jgi:hypothetical protein
MAPRKAIKFLFLLMLTPLGGCFYLAETHPTTESRIMTPDEQQNWRNPQSRHEKGQEWARTLERQSGDRLARFFSDHY